ncbi:MAG: putative alpha/beta superfamily hydrolase, partial [Limisphaerales bacterium]
YSTSKKYPVLYMHDGQSLFRERPNSGWGGDEWGVDEFLDTLGLDVIVVGVYNTTERYADYMPAKPYDAVQAELLVNEDLKRWNIDAKIVSDKYLDCLVNKIKPLVDSIYSTKTDQQNTFVAGSSMGGLISCYALGEYPEVFGGAACFSTHLPALKGVFLEYLEEEMPEGKGQRLWMDHGTESLDSTYAPFQGKADLILADKGYEFSSKVYEGASHSEVSWRARLPEVLGWLFADISN